MIGKRIGLLTLIRLVPHSKVNLHRSCQKQKKIQLKLPQLFFIPPLSQQCMSEAALFYFSKLNFSFSAFSGASFLQLSVP